MKQKSSSTMLWSTTRPSQPPSSGSLNQAYMHHAIVHVKLVAPLSELKLMTDVYLLGDKDVECC